MIFSNHSFPLSFGMNYCMPILLTKNATVLRNSKRHLFFWTSLSVCNSLYRRISTLPSICPTLPTKALWESLEGFRGPQMLQGWHQPGNIYILAAIGNQILWLATRNFTKVATGLYKPLFRCVLASLYEGLSVRRSVGRSVRRSVRPSVGHAFVENKGN